MLFALCLPALFHVLELVLELDLAVTELGGTFVLLVGDGFFLLAAQAVESLARLLVGRRSVGALDAHAGGGLVNEVDGLVGQETVRNVARRQLSRGFEGLV